MVPDRHFVENSQLLVRNLSDIVAIKAVPLSSALPESTYATLVSAAKRSPDAKTLSLLSADCLAAPHIGSVSMVSAWSLSRATLFAVRRPSSRSVGCLGNVRTSHGSPRPLMMALGDSQWWVD
jgi:hypothetical protein